jgi:CRISPR-associated protein Cmr3
MMPQTIRIRGVDPLLFRDGRPFTNELGAQRADSLPVPPPGVVAGAVRTAIGNAEGWDWRNGGSKKALAIPVHGPVVMLGEGEPVAAAPADAVIYRESNDQEKPLQCMCLRPRQTSAGCNMPEGVLPMQVTRQEKPERGYRFWRWEDLMRWLEAPTGEGFDPLPACFANIGNPTVEERTHVMIGEQGVAKDGMLYTTASVSPLEVRRAKGKSSVQEWSYLARVEHAAGVSGPLFLGGERRVAAASPAEGEWPACPGGLAKALAGSQLVRMVLITPAIFSGGWKPGWAGGAPPGAEGLTLTLKAACVSRREAISGWDYAAHGPKALRWMAPAGSVYFFQAQGDTSQLAAGAWLSPVSDNEQDRRDGYGLAVWGIWNNEGVNG